MKRLIALIIPAVLIFSLAIVSEEALSKGKKKKKKKKKRAKHSTTEIYQEETTPVDSGPFAGKIGYPYTLNGNYILGYDYFEYASIAVSQLYRVEKGVFLANAKKMDRKDSEKFDSGKYVLDFDRTSMELAGVYRTPVGLVLGLSLEKDDSPIKLSTVGDSPSEIKLKTKYTNISIFGAYPIKDKMIFGLQFITRGGDVEIMGTSSSESFTELVPSLTKYTDESEITISWVPPINISEDGFSAARPATIFLNYCNKIGPESDFVLFFQNQFRNAINSDDKNQPILTSGMNFYNSVFDFGFLLTYAHKYFMEKEESNPMNIASYGLTLTGNHHFDETTDIGLYARYNLGEGKGESDSGESSKLKHQEISYLGSLIKKF